MSVRTASDVVTAAAIEIGAIGIGQTLDGAELTVAIDAMNRFISQSNVAKQNLFTLLMNTFVLIASQGIYTWGIDPNGVATADINLARPPQNFGVEDIVLELETTPSIIRMPPMEKLTARQYAAIAVPNIPAIPLKFYWDGNYTAAAGFGSLYFWPYPQTTYTVELWRWMALQRVAAGTDAIMVPLEYEQWFHYHLSKILCGPFQRPVPDLVVDGVREANDAIAGINSEPPKIEADPALTRSRYSRGNYIQGWFVK